MAGQEILTSAYQYLVDEILPADRLVTWDLSDLKGIKIVEDASGDQGSLLPQVISPEDLAAQAPHSYVLKTSHKILWRESPPPHNRNRASPLPT